MNEAIIRMLDRYECQSVVDIWGRCWRTCRKLAGEMPDDL